MKLYDFRLHQHQVVSIPLSYLVNEISFLFAQMGIEPLKGYYLPSSETPILVDGVDYYQLVDGKKVLFNHDLTIVSNVYTKEGAITLPVTLRSKVVVASRYTPKVLSFLERIVDAYYFASRAWLSGGEPPFDILFYNSLKKELDIVLDNNFDIENDCFPLIVEEGLNKIDEELSTVLNLVKEFFKVNEWSLLDIKIDKYKLVLTNLGDYRVEEYYRMIAGEVHDEGTE